jgi:hypothetical protein
MLMIDVRNAIANILDRYTLGQVVEVTLHKMRRDHVPLPFSAPKEEAQKPSRRVADPAAGFLNALGISTHDDEVPVVEKTESAGGKGPRRGR